VHDGDADDTNSYYLKYATRDPQGNVTEELGSQRLNSWNSNNIARDKTSKFEMRIDRDGMHDVVMEWFKHTTGSKIFGFFLMNQDRSTKRKLGCRYVYSDGLTIEDKCFKEGVRNYGVQCELEKELYDKFKKEKFLVSKVKGFNSFFFVVGGNSLQTEEEQIEISGKVTASKLKSAFMKYNKNKAVNRVLVSKFIEGIAA
jgi:hypothetical protein